VLALLIVHWLVAATTPAAEESVWLLERANWQREETALLEALRIYTRDLKVPITISAIPSQAETREDQRAVARTRCASDASIVVWFSGDSTTPGLLVLRCVSEKEYWLPLLPAEDLDLAAQTLALKIRGLLTEAAPGGAGGQAGTSVAREPAPTQKAAPKVGSETAVLVRRNLDIEVGLAYAFGAADAFSGLREGALLRLAVVSMRWPIALEVDGAVSTSVVSGAGGYRLTMSEIPIGVALSARMTLASWTLSCGPRVSLHLVQADGVSPDGRSGSTTNLSTGLGALEQVRYRASKAASLSLSLSNEAIVPRRRFTLDGRDRLDVGLFQWTLAAGVVLHF
jgi:hypothetical protein